MDGKDKKLTQKILKILKSLYVEVEDIGKFNRDVSSVMNLFDKIREFKGESRLEDFRLKIEVDKLRDDIPKKYDEEFFSEYRGKYIPAPRSLSSSDT